MAIRIAGVTVPAPSDLLGAARTVVGWGGQAAQLAAELPDRAARLLAEVENLVVRINYLAERADVLIDRVDAVAEAAAQTVVLANSVADSAATSVDRANLVVDDAGRISSTAATVLADAARLSDGAGDLLGTYRPLADRAAPLAATFVNELSEAEVIAAIRLIDQLPRLAEHMQTDIMPTMATLDRVGPDVRELLTVVKDLRHAINTIPGLAYLRRRGAPSGP